ncbi:MAG: transaldolase [Rubellimicrobium sp.]|nr:transaldolase [Rubellimicrobium sp.]
MTSKLEQLRSMTVVVGDTGDIDAVRRMKPEDCTTNPSIVLKAVKTPAFADEVAKVIEAGKGRDNAVDSIAQDLTIMVGATLAGIVPGYVSTEVDARLSFDRDRSVAKAKALVAAYGERGVGPDRILIKLASTWEGIEAARILEAEGVRCNMTLLFSMAQAVASAEAGAYLISPFVGRITDWYGKATGETYTPETDPGVASVRSIYDYYKSNGIGTIVMGASFRNPGQIEALAGCDRLTIAPALMEQLDADKGDLPRALSPEGASGVKRRSLTEEGFRWEMNEDAMATEKLAEGIRNFQKDTLALHALIEGRLKG